MKGIFLVLYCCIGLGLSGISFVFFGIGPLVLSAGLILSDLMSVNWSGLSLSDVGRLLAGVWVIGGVILSLLVYGPYGLVYWFQQLKRLPPYVDFWEQHWRGEAQEAPPSSVKRPPGLFLPGDAILIIFAGMAWSVGNEVWWPGLIGFGLVWPVAVGIVAWSIRASYVGVPQPLDNEGRNVAVALILQLATIDVWGIVLARSAGSSLSLGFTFFTLSILVVGSLLYLPDIVVYSDRSTGVVSYLSGIYVGGICTLLLLMFDIFGQVPLSIYIIIIIVVFVFLTIYFRNVVSAQ